MGSEVSYDPNDKKQFRRKTLTGAEADSAVAKEKFTDVSGLAAASRKAKAEREKRKKGYTAGDAADALAGRK